jgi:hypothetical protein
MTAGALAAILDRVKNFSVALPAEYRQHAARIADRGPLGCPP